MKVTKLKSNEVFVFNSNYLGMHRTGSARKALEYGAKWGRGEGLHGQTYAIPTKFSPTQRLPMGDIEECVSRFIRKANSRQDLIFRVAPMDSGLAGRRVEQIAELFRGCLELKNVILPIEFLRILK